MAATKQKIITIENPLMGWISDYASAATPLDGAVGQYRNSFGMTVVRPGKMGSITPAEIFNGASFTDVGPALNSLPRAIASDSNIAVIPSAVANSYQITDGAAALAPRIVISNNTNTTTSHHDITATNNFSTLPATARWGEDIIFYPSVNGSVSTNSDYIFYSWNDSGEGNVGQYDVAANSYDDNYMSTVPVGAAALTKGLPHRMCVGSDRIMYITNGQFVASYDGTQDQTGANGTFNPQALDLGPGWLALDVAYYNSEFIAILASKVGTAYNIPTYSCETRVILWNGSDLDFSELYDLKDWFGGSLFSKDGELFAFTQGANGTTKAKYLPLNAPSFVPIWEAPTSIVGAAPLPNQVEYFNNLIMWAGDTTTNMVFGLLQTETGYALHTPYYLSSGSSVVSKTGFLKNLNSNILFAGVLSNTNKVIGVIGDGASNGSIVTSLAINKVQFRSALIELDYRDTINKIIAYFSSFGSDSSMYISLIPNHTPYSEDVNGNPVGDLLAWNISTSTDANVVTNQNTSSTKDPTIGRIPDISKFWINVKNLNTSVSATPPMLRKLEFYIDPTNQP